jgi:two-component system OmpR family response regulator
LPSKKDCGGSCRHDPFRGDAVPDISKRRAGNPGGVSCLVAIRGTLRRQQASNGLLPDAGERHSEVEIGYKAPMKILVIEDDREAADYLEKAFAEAGHTVHVAGDGDTGFALAESGDYDVMVVDRMLPRRDGLSVIAALRSRGNTTPVLTLSALGEVDDRVTGLRAGSDDYLTKPYAFSELLARVEVLNRRASSREAETVYRVGDLELDRLSHEVRRAGREITLQPREFRLLEYLMRHGGQVVTRTMLLENVWDYHFDPQTNVIDVHVSRLRGKIEKGFDKPILHTVRGAGYMLKAG